MTSQTVTDFREHISYIIEDKSLGMHKFYDTYGRFIKITAFYYCKDDDKSNEVVNQVLIKVWKNAKKLKEISNPLGWLYRVTINCTKDLFKRRVHLPLNEYILADEDAFEELLSLDSFEWLISSLDKHEQQIMNYKFIQRFSFQEIAKIMGKPLSTISSIYYRAQEKIKEKLKKMRKNLL